MVRSASVLGQAHTPRRRFLPFAAVALVVLAAPAASGAITSHGVAGLRAHDASLAAKSRSAVLGLYSLDQQLASANARLAELQRQAASLRAQRALLAEQLRVARHGTRIAELDLGARIRQLYEQGSVEPLEIVFGAKSLDEAMTNIDSLSRVSRQSEDVLAQLKLAKHQLASASRALASRTASLHVATNAAVATRDSLSHARAERSSYIASLAAERSMTRRQLTGLEAQAHAAQVRSAELARARAAAAPATAVAADSTFSPPAPAPAPAAVPASATAAPVAGERTITVSATGYSLPGSTATGLPVGWGVVAVDPSVIPLGTHMAIPGYGEAVAADTGGAIVGSTIDLWFPTVAQANAWGRRTVTIVLH